MFKFSIWSINENAFVFIANGWLPPLFQRISNAIWTGRGNNNFIAGIVINSLPFYWKRTGYYINYWWKENLIGTVCNISITSRTIQLLIWFLKTKWNTLTTGLFDLNWHGTNYQQQQYHKKQYIVLVIKVDNWTPTNILNHKDW